MNRPQATRATRPQVLLHISRQRALGANTIRGSDKPHAADLLVTAALVAAVLAANAFGYW